MVNGKLHSRLGKGRAMLAVVHGLCEAGISPDEVKQVLHRKKHVLKSVCDTVSASVFLDRMEARRRSGEWFVKKRYFLKSDHELILSQGSTYALWNQWGTGTVEAINALIAAFPDAGV